MQKSALTAKSSESDNFAHKAVFYLFFSRGVARRAKPDSLLYKSQKRDMLILAIIILPNQRLNSLGEVFSEVEYN